MLSQGQPCWSSNGVEPGSGDMKSSALSIHILFLYLYVTFYIFIWNLQTAL